MARLRRLRERAGRTVRGEVQGSIRARSMRAAKDLPEPVGPRRMRMGKGPSGRRAERSQEKQRDQSASECWRFTEERRVSRGRAGPELTSGFGNEQVGVELSKWTRLPLSTFQPAAEISMYSPSGLARSIRILSGTGPWPRLLTRRPTRILRQLLSREAWDSMW